MCKEREYRKRVEIQAPPPLFPTTLVLVTDLWLCLPALELAGDGLVAGDTMSRVAGEHRVIARTTELP